MEDLHKKTAAKMFGVPEDQVTPEQRQAGKRANYFSMYPPHTGRPNKTEPAIQNIPGTPASKLEMLEARHGQIVHKARSIGASNIRSILQTMLAQAALAEGMLMVPAALLGPRRTLINVAVRNALRSWRSA